MQNHSLVSLQTEQVNHLDDSQKGEVVHTGRFKLGAKFEGIRGVQSMGMGDDIAMLPTRVHCCQSEVVDENNLRSFKRLFNDMMI